MFQKYGRQLEDFGLTTNEVRVYIALLQHGSGAASTVAKSAALNRSTTYVQLNSLLSYGLVSSYKAGKKTYFSAESPENLSRLLDQKIEKIQIQKENIKFLIPDLLNVYAENDSTPGIRTFEGKGGLMTMRNELVNSGVAEYHAAYSFDDLYRIFTEEELVDFSNRRAQAGIFSYVLYNKKGHPAVKAPSQELKRVKKEEFPFGADIYVYGDTVSIAATSGKIFGVTITNKQISDTARSLFLLAWHNVK